MNVESKENMETKPVKKPIALKGLLHIIIGFLIILLGLFLMVRSHFDLPLNLTYKPDIYDQIFGILIMLYGGFRIYRGIKKK